MKYLKKICMLALLFVMCIAKDVQASGLENAVISPEGLQICMIPCGPNGMVEYGENGEEKKSFWLYVEMIGKEKKPYVESQWKLEGEIYNLENGTDSEPVLVLESSDFELTQAGTGFWVGRISIITKYEYQDHELVLTLWDDQQVLEKRQEVVADIIVKWPELSVDSWKAEVSDFEKLNPGIVTFDWENSALFERLFQVEVEHNYQNLKTEHVSDNTWQLKLDDELTGEITIRLSDKLEMKPEMERTYSYNIEVTEKDFPIGIVLVVILLVGIAAVVIMKLHGGKGEERGKKPQDTSFSIDQEIDRAKTNLIDTKTEWKNELERYIKQLENNKKLIETYGSRTDFYADLQSIEELKKNVMIDADSLEEVKNAEQTLNLLRNGESGGDYEWVIRKLNDRTNAFKKEKEEYSKKTSKIPEEIAKWKREKAELERPLGMDVEITVTKRNRSAKVEVYVFDIDHNECGFVLDEKTPLKLDKTNAKDGYDWNENRKFEDIFGKKLGIKIAATGKDYILLTGEKEKELRQNENYEFTVVLADGNLAEILVKTT